MEYLYLLEDVIVLGQVKEVLVVPLEGLDEVPESILILLS